jgi:vancomycin resistance protein YoaR
MLRIVLVVVLALLVVAALAVGMAAGTAPEPGTVPAGVEIGGVPVGGLSQDDAVELISEESAERLRRPLTVSMGEIEAEVIPRAVGLSIDVEASVEQAMGPVDEDSLLTRLWERVGGSSDTKAHPLVITVDDVLLTSALDELALPVERLVKDGRIIFDGAQPKAVAADAGLLLDREALMASLSQALAYGDDAVTAVLQEVPPTITTENIQDALAAVRTALSAPLTLGYQGSTFELSTADLAAMASPNPSGLKSGIPISFDTDAAHELLEQRLAPILDPPVEAQVVPNDDGKGFTITPSEDGTLVEWPALFSAMARVAVDDERRYVPIPTAAVRPRLTTLDAQMLTERADVASFTTYFSPANAARVNNIQQVARILDGMVIRPGETFSFNKAVGPRTRAAGFDEAPVIRNGVLTPGVGGGICQVSTTLFNAAFFAGLPVVDRRPHGFYIDHYPVGRDATVSYGSTDFRFKNDSDTLLLLSVTTTDQSVTVSLAAPEWDRTVEYTTSDFYDIVEPRSSLEHPRRLRDPELAKGTTSPVEPGVTGRTVVVERTVSDPSGILFKDTFKSVYAPKDYVIRVGG